MQTARAILKIQFTNDNLMTGEMSITTVSAKVLRGKVHITSKYVARVQVPIKEAILTDAAQLIEQQRDIYIYRWYAVSKGISGFVPWSI